MRTTIDLPDDLYRQTKATAALRGLKMKDFIQGVLEKALGLASDEGPAKHRKLPAGIRRATGEAIPALSNARIETILLDEDIH